MNTEQLVAFRLELLKIASNIVLSINSSSQVGYDKSTVSAVGSEIVEVAKKLNLFAKLD